MISKIRKTSKKTNAADCETKNGFLEKENQNWLLVDCNFYTEPFFVSQSTLSISSRLPYFEFYKLYQYR